jgi:hypothetical protein
MHRAIRQPDGKETPLPQGCKDPVSAFYALRRVDWRTQSSRTLLLFDGQKILSLQAEVVGRGEGITVSARSFRTTKLKITLHGENRQPVLGEINAWLTEDRQVPVKLEASLKFGSLGAELQSLP